MGLRVLHIAVVTLGFFAVASLLGCDESEPASIAPDTQIMDQGRATDVATGDAAVGNHDAGALQSDGQVGPQVMTPGADAPASAHVVPVVNPNRWSVLDDGRFLVQAGTVLSLFESESETVLGDSFGDLIRARNVGEEVVVVTSEGVYVLGPEGLERSPVDGFVEGVIGLVKDGSEGAWFVSQTGLSRWHGGQLQDVRLPNVSLDWSQAKTSAGWYEGRDVLWTASDRELVAIGTERAWHFEWNERIDWITNTAQGLWIANGSNLHQLDRQGQWAVWARPERSSIGVGSLQSNHLWMSSGLALYQWDGSILRRRSGAPDHSGLQVDADGTAYLANLTGIHRVVAGRFLGLAGLEDGARVARVTAIEISPSDIDQVSSITVQIDEDDPAALEGPPWSIELDPETFGPGAHALTIEIRYDDGQILSQRVAFLGPPTWVADVQPLQEMYCVSCHGDGGSAHVMSSFQAWRDEIAAIIDDVETGRMPYGGPRLTVDLVQLIRDWRDSGFVEQ